MHLAILLGMFYSMARFEVADITNEPSPCVITGAGDLPRVALRPSHGFERKKDRITRPQVPFLQAAS